MTGTRKRQLQKRFCRHIHPVKTFRGDPARPGYTLYSLHHYPTYLAAMNELGELVEQWPHNSQRTVALLAVQQAYYDYGAPHLEAEMVQQEDRHNVDGLMLYKRRLMQRSDPEKAAHYERNLLLAEAALRENQRRKQGHKTGKGPLRSLQGAKSLVFTPATLRPN